MCSVVMRTALDGLRGRLERQPLTRRLRNVNAEHQAHSSVLPSDVCFSFPQLDVGVPQLQDSSAVDSEQTCQMCVFKTSNTDMFSAFLKSVMQMYIVIT